MLKQTISFTDYNGNKSEETLYFNLTRTEVLEMQGIQERLESWLESVRGEEREMTSSEKLEMLNIIKLLIRTAYGVRSADGKRFMKNDELFTDFAQSAVYDEFIVGLFTDPENAVKFMNGILPKEVLDNIPENELSSSTAQVVELPQPETKKDPTPWITENREPTRVELANMTPEQLQNAFRQKMSIPDGSDNA